MTRTRPGSHLLDHPGDMLLKLSGLCAEGGDPLAEPDQGLVQDPSLAVHARWAGQLGAFFGPPLAGQRPAPFA